MKLVTIYAILLVLTFLAACAEGPRGATGANGKDGKPGTGCTVIQVENGAKINCGEHTSAVILNGTQGPKGEPMVPGPYEVKALINPCGKVGSHDEIIIRIGTNELIAHYSHGNKQFFTILGPGNYQTTDGTNCNFTVTSNLDVTW